MGNHHFKQDNCETDPFFKGWYCDGMSCGSGSDCASGYCDDGTCESRDATFYLLIIGSIIAAIAIIVCVICAIKRRKKRAAEGRQGGR